MKRDKQRSGDKHIPSSVGRGHKLCPSCTTIVGARTKTCKCGHDFSPKVEGWDSCKSNMIRILSKTRSGMDLIEIAVTRKSKPHQGCLKDKCRMDNKQLQLLLAELVKEGKVKKDGKKYKVAR